MDVSACQSRIHLSESLLLAPMLLESKIKNANKVSSLSVYLRHTAEALVFIPDPMSHQSVIFNFLVHFAVQHLNRNSLLSLTFAIVLPEDFLRLN